jgi:hypothetical protein
MLLVELVVEQLEVLVQQVEQTLVLVVVGQSVMATETTVVLVLFLLGGKFNGTFCKNK